MIEVVERGDELTTLTDQQRQNQYANTKAKHVAHDEPERSTSMRRRWFVGHECQTTDGVLAS